MFVPIYSREYRKNLEGRISNKRRGFRLLRIKLPADGYGG
jgi:hypothetical protein